MDIVKIDKTFVSMVRTGTERLPILSSMINMAHSLGLTVTTARFEQGAQESGTGAGRVGERRPS